VSIPGIQHVEKGTRAKQTTGLWPVHFDAKKNLTKFWHYQNFGIVAKILATY
jgi:hypothetical protein